MGMFDYIRCKMPMPTEPAPPSIEWFQTKDTPTAFLWMDKWTIEEDGRLVKHGYRVEDRSDPNAKGLMRLCRAATRIDEPENDETVPFHGDIGFGHYDTKTKEDWDYIARFTRSEERRVGKE